MAYVKKSDSALEEIKNNVRRMFNTQLTHARRWDNYGLTIEELNDKIWNAIMPADVYKKIEDLQQLMPNCFASSTGCRVKIALTHGSTPNYQQLVIYDLAFGSTRPLPNGWGIYSTDEAPLCRDLEVMKIAQERAAKCEAVEGMLKSFLSEIATAWEAVSSVNAFVKVWPQGRDLLPREIINRLDQKTERTKSDVTINTAALNTELLKAKIMA